MVVTNLRFLAGMWVSSLLLGGALAYHASAGVSRGKATATVLSPDQFDKLRSLIKPKPGGFDDLPWMTDLWEAGKKAAEQGKPLLVWVGDGHPLGWT